MKKIIIVGLMGFVMAILFVGLITLVGWLIDVRPDFGIAALCFICLKIADDLYNEANKED